MMKLLVLSLTTLTLSLLVGCEPNDFKEGVVMAGGQYVPAATLNKGKQIYSEYCMACHGVNGDGNGVAAKGLQPPPRNFKLGIIKFGNVVSGELTHDDAVYKSFKHGLNGSAMLPWDLKQDQMVAVWQYIKTFAPDTWVGKDKELGTKLDAQPFKDPFTIARKDQAIELGRKVFHVEANCQSCHRGYVTLSEYSAMSKELTGDGIAELDSDFYQLKIQDSDHGYQVVPPDFTWHELRSVRNGETEIEDLYLRLLGGVGGTAMPAWKDTLEDHKIWALAYYVNYLRSFKNSPERKNFVARFK
ncbi:MAG: c-type cytochrome [Bacteriovoracaceae bacterium]|nr:c-type cytochrome [Bacteriovoracaceae bacterium]